VTSGFRSIVKSAMRRAGVVAYSREHLPFGANLLEDLGRLTDPSSLGVVFDIGANVGGFARLFAPMTHSRVLAFEPSPRTYESLKTNVARMSNAECFNLALGSAPGEASLRVHTDGSVTDSLVDGDADDGAARVSVQVDTVDRVAERLGVERIDLLKSDTEGYDLEVLKGAEAMLRAGRVRFIFCECEMARVTPEPHTSFFDLHPFLAHRGFRCVAVYTDVTGPTGMHWGNALFAYIGADAGATSGAAAK